LPSLFVFHKVIIRIQETNTPPSSLVPRDNVVVPSISYIKTIPKTNPVNPNHPTTKRKALNTDRRRGAAGYTAKRLFCMATTKPQKEIRTITPCRKKA